MSSKSASQPVTPQVHSGEVVLRLDCWHYYKFGQQKELNKQLAEAFEKHKLEAWKVFAADTAGRNIAGTDTLVPISVDFKHSQSPEKTEVACRDDSRQLRTTVHETFLEFFNTQKLNQLWYTMHARNMDSRFAIEHYYFECMKNQNWKILTRGISIPRSYDLGGSKKYSTAKIADAASKAGSVAFKCGKAAEERRDNQKKPSMSDPKCGKAAEERRDNQKKPSMSDPEKARLIPEVVEATRAIFDAGLDVWETAQANSTEAGNILQTAAQSVAAPFNEFKEDFQILQQKLEILRKTDEPSPDAVVDLVKRMSAMRVTFSKLKQSLVPFVGTVQKKRNSETLHRGIGTGIGAVVAIYAVCYFCPPVVPLGIYGWVTGVWTGGALTVGGIAGAVGGAGAGRACYNSYTVKKIADNVEVNQREVDKAIDPLFSMLGILFCKKVLQMPFEHLRKDQQIKYLNDLGIPINDINNRVFLKEKLDDVARNFIKACNDLIKNVDLLASEEGELFDKLYGE